MQAMTADEMIVMLPEPHPYWCGCPDCGNYERLLFDKAQTDPFDPATYEPPF